MAFKNWNTGLGSGLAAWLAAAVLLAAVPTSASPPAGGSTIAWHGDLEQALAAARNSGRPVLAIFTASWAPAGGAIDRTALASPEAAALVGVCFEPVCVDIDANPEATRRHGVNRVPLACVLSADDRLIASFDVPEQPAQFVAAAAHAARVAGTAASPAGATGGPDENDVTTAPATQAGATPRRSATVSAFGSELPTPGVAHQTGSGDGRDEPSAASVAAKVRRLSAFATAETAADGAAVAATFQGPGAARQHGTTWPPADAATGQVAQTPRIEDVARSNDTLPQPESTPVAAATRTSAFTAATTPAAPSAWDPTVPQGPPAAPQQPVATTVGTGPTAAAGAGSATAGTFAGTVAGSPLAIEPAPQLPAAPSAGGTPWLEPKPHTAPPLPPAAGAGALASAAPATTPIEPQAKSAADRPAEPAAPKPAAGTAASFIAALQKPFTLFGKPAKPVKTEAKEATSTDASPTAVAAAESPAPTDALGSMPLGLEGYCPVTLAERGAWVEGRAQWGARHRGRTYLFAGPEQQQAFLNDPDRFAPALSGDDPVLAFDAGRSTPGHRRYGVTYQARMYLFSSQETRDAFAANPQRYTTGTVVAENRSTTVR